MTTASPSRVSFVATSRNDDHGGNLLGRMQTFVSGLAAQCERHRLDAELILVEWNPPADRPRLIDALRWPGDSARLRVRIIEVPPTLHARFPHAEALPLFQMIAKNVGIRRARSAFVVATNVDLLFSDALMGFLASQKLRSDRMYRVDRYDVHSVPEGTPIQEQLAACRRNRLRVCAKYGTYTHPTSLRTRLQRTFESIRQRLANLRRQFLGVSHDPPLLHTNACGDFTLLSRDSWFELRGYPEIAAFSMNLDSILCFMGHYAGIAEVVLPGRMCVYHLEHGLGWTPEGDLALRQCVAQRGLLWIDWEQVLTWARKMASAPTIFNSEEWGLAGESLSEVSPGSGSVYSTA